MCVNMYTPRCCGLKHLRAIKPISTSREEPFLQCKAPKTLQAFSGALARFQAYATYIKHHQTTSGKTRLKKGLPRQKVCQHSPRCTNSRMVALACHSTFENFASKELGTPSLNCIGLLFKINTALLTCITEHQSD